jgi:hypothetical protein
MGLDWIPIGRPQLGHESEHAGLFAALTLPLPDTGDALLKRERRDARKAQWQHLRDISVSPHEAVRSLRVGRDKEADEWLEKAYRDGRLDSARYSLAEVKARMAGAFIVETAAPSDGISLFSNGGTFDDIPGYAFRAQFLRDPPLRAILGDKLPDRAWLSFSSQEIAEYADDLDHAARSYAQRDNLTIPDARTVLEWRDLSDPEFSLMVLDAAIRWCRFWARVGSPVYSSW